jgi:hypothetical protein
LSRIVDRHGITLFVQRIRDGRGDRGVVEQISRAAVSCSSPGMRVDAQAVEVTRRPGFEIAHQSAGSRSADRTTWTWLSYGTSG